MIYIPRRKNYKNGKKIDKLKSSALTKVSFWLSVVAILVLITIGVRNINERFGQVCIFEAIMCFAGIIFIDPLRGEDFSLNPKNKNFKEIDKNIVFHTIIIFMSITVIQFIFSGLTFSIREVELALAIVFAAIAEEIFFRGLMINLGLKLTGESENKQYYAILIIICSGLIFGLFHINYWSYGNIMWTVALGGIALGYFYYRWDDLTACIFAHLILNLIVVGQTFFLVNL